MKKSHPEHNGEPKNNALMVFDAVNTKIITIRNTNVILDADVAALYGVETRDINKSVKNNPRKFPNEEYIFDLKVNELDALLNSARSSYLLGSQHPVENFHRILNVKHLTSIKAFTEKGLYMLATILKSDRAIDTTLAIVETFAKLKELQTNIALLNTMDPKAIQPEIIESTGSLLDEILFSGHPTSAKTSMELNLGIMKLKREITSEKFDRQTEFEELKKMMKDIREQNKQLLKKK